MGRQFTHSNRSGLFWLLSAAAIVLVLGVLAASAQAGPEPAIDAEAAPAASALASNVAATEDRLAAAKARLAATQRRLERAQARERAHERKLKRAERREARAEQALGEISTGEGPALDADNPCADNIALAAENGLHLPAEYELHCPGPGADWEGNSHWGVTCPYADCPEGAGPYVSISNPTYYVVAHELCHAQFGYGADAELAADACAAEHGASLETSPYS